MESEILYEVPSSLVQYLKKSQNPNVFVFSALPEDPEWELYLVPFVVVHGVDGAATRALPLSTVAALDRKKDTLMDLPPTEISKLDTHYLNSRMDRILEVIDRGEEVKKMYISNKDLAKPLEIPALIDKEMATLLKELYLKTGETGKVYPVPYLESTKKEEEEKKEKKSRKKEEIIIKKESDIEIFPIKSERS